MVKKKKKTVASFLQFVLNELIYFCFFSFCLAVNSSRFI